MKSQTIKQKTKSKPKKQPSQSIVKSKIKNVEKRANIDLAPLRDRLLLTDEWSHALASLQGHKRAGIAWEYVGKHDMKPIAELLKGAEPIPQYVRDTLSRLLNPPKGYQGGKFKYLKPSKRAIQRRNRLNKEMHAYEYIRDLVEVKKPKTKFDTAVEMAAKKYGMSLSWARNLKKITADNWFSSLFDTLDPGTLLP